MFKRLFASAIIFGTAALAPPVAHAQSAQTACAPRAAIVKTLTERYSEQLSAGGVQSSAQILEIFWSVQSGSWTALVTRADGISCVVASGLNWHQSGPQLSDLDPSG